MPDSAPDRHRTEACPLCGCTSLRPLLDRREVPVLLNQLQETADAARSSVRGRLKIVACCNCGFVFNAAFDAALVGYDSHYENDQSASPAFRAHMSAMADRILVSLPDRSDIRVLEIGCGQARFLSELVEKFDGRISVACGYDPAWRGGATKPPIHVEPRRFAVGTLRPGSLPADVIVARHIIEHLPRPVEFLVEIRAAMPSKWYGRLFVETPRLEWMISGRVIHDFFYEHCNYFTAATLRYALARAGFRSLEIQPVFNDQYQLADAVPAPGPPMPLEGAGPPDGSDHLAAYEREYIARWLPELAARRADGAIAVWGAGAKGVTFVNMIDRDAALIAYLVDVNPQKQGCFTPLTAHPVRDPRCIAQDDIRTVIVMNPNYRAEIAAELERIGARPVLIDA